MTSGNTSSHFPAPSLTPVFARSLVTGRFRPWCLAQPGGKGRAGVRAGIGTSLRAHAAPSLVRSGSARRWCPDWLDAVWYSSWLVGEAPLVGDPLS
jgi:hypothetical protein